MWTEDATNSAFEVFEGDRLAGLVEDEPDAVFWIDRPDEEVPRLGDRNVLAKTNSECEWVAVEVRE
jgi:hypothetical protein